VDAIFPLSRARYGATIAPATVEQSRQNWFHGVTAALVLFGTSRRAPAPNARENAVQSPYHNASNVDSTRDHLKSLYSRRDVQPDTGPPFCRLAGHAGALSIKPGLGR